MFDVDFRLECNVFFWRWETFCLPPSEHDVLFWMSIFEVRERNLNIMDKSFVSKTKGH